MVERKSKNGKREIENGWGIYMKRAIKPCSAQKERGTLGCLMAGFIIEYMTTLPSVLAMDSTRVST